MRYVVTGAAGFIGSHLAEALAQAGHEVLGVDCFTDYYERPRKEENAAAVDLVEADLVEAPLVELLEAADGVFHLAAQPGVRGGWGEEFDVYARHNLLATQRVFEAATATGARVVFASSSSVYGDAESYPTPEDVPPRPISPYGVTKLGCEHLAHAFASGGGFDCSVVRYFTVYGPRQRPDMAFTRLLEALATGGSFRLFGDGSFSRSFTYVADAVAGTIAAMERGGPGRVYNIGGGEEASMTEVIALAERIAGRRLDVDRAAPVVGDVRRTKADTARAERELGWRPTTSLEDGLHAHWRWAAGRVGAR